MPKPPREHDDPTTAARSALHRISALSVTERASALAEAILCCDAAERAVYFPALAQLAAAPLARRGVLRPISSREGVLPADHALSCVAKCYGVLDVLERELALATGEGRWERAVLEARRDSRRLVQESLATLASEAGDATLGAVAVELLASASPLAAERAELALVAMVVLAGLDTWSEQERACWESAQLDEPWRSALRRGWARGLEGGASRVDAALDRALAGFETHRRRGVLLALLLRAGRVEARGSARLRALVESVLTNREHPAHDSLMSMLRLSKLPVARVRALEWLPATRSSRAGVDRLAHAESRLDQELVLVSSHLAQRPARRIALQGEAQRSVDLPSPRDVSRLSARARRSLAKWCTVCEPRARERERVLSALLRDEDPVVRATCVAHAPRALLLDLALDEHERVSRSALVAWIDAGETGRADEDLSRARDAVLEQFARMPHPTVRTIAALERRGDDRWRRELRVTERRDPAALLESLRRGLLSPDRDEVIVSLSRARRLCVVDALEGTLREVLAGAGARSARADERIRAAVVAALGDARTPILSDALRDAMDDADSRVRASAVESLARRARRSGASGAMVECKPLLAQRLAPSVAHRERANALRACIEGWVASEPGAPDELLSMLTDERPAQRLAGAWLAGRVLAAHGPLRLHPRYPEIVACVAEVGRFDSEPRVRARASRCAAMVEGGLASWLATGVSEIGAEGA